MADEPWPVEEFSDGDLVFRRGIGLMSRAVLVADGSGMYSHVGILKKVEEEWHVIHAVEPLVRFWATDRAVRGAVMRMEVDSQLAAGAAVQAWQIAQRGTLFDHDYDLADTTAMYCTELVDFVYRKVGVDVSEGRLSRVNVPGVGGDYLLPSDLADNRQLKPVFEFSR